jgi:hypothetical protein
MNNVIETLLEHTTSVTGYKLLHDVILTKVRFWMHDISLQNHGAVLHMTTVKCFQICGLILREINDGEVVMNGVK